MERRYLEAVELRVAAAEDGAARHIEGYAAIFNQRSLDLGGFVEEILPGAFTRTLQARDQVALWSHDTSKPLGRKSRGTLTISEDETGLSVRITPPDTSWGRDALVSVERGDAQGMSFGFIVPQGGDAWRQEGGKVIRSLIDVDLIEFSPVVFPAYPQTSATTREIYGDNPVIPAELSGARGEADIVGSRALERVARERLRLDLINQHGRAQGHAPTEEK
jgi:HK97 family phage prohead protease